VVISSKSRNNITGSPKNRLKKSRTQQRTIPKKWLKLIHTNTYSTVSCLSVFKRIF
jgi:hypothetical protein